MFNRLAELINLNDDLNEKNRKLEYMLSFHDKSKEKSTNLDEFSQGINLDYLTLENNSEPNEETKPQQEEKNQDNYTINMKVKIKKPGVGVGSYGMNRNEHQVDKRKKTLMEVTELLHQKPLSKV